MVISAKVQSLCIAGAVFFLSVAWPCLTAAASQWLVTGYTLGKSASLSKAEAEAWMGKAVLMDETSIIVGEKKCQISPSPQEVDAMDYFATQFHIKPAELGIRERKAVILHTQCDIPGFDPLIPLGDGRLAFFRDGVFFYLTQVHD